MDLEVTRLGTLNLNLELTRLGALEAGRHKARNFGIWERHESRKIEMKETRWNGTRRLDRCVNDCC